VTGEWLRVADHETSAWLAGRVIERYLRCLARVGE